MTPTSQQTNLPVIAYNMSAAAGYLGVTVTQISRLIDQGRLVEMDGIAGGGRYLTPESVEAYKREREAAAGGQ